MEEKKENISARECVVEWENGERVALSAAASEIVYELTCSNFQRVATLVKDMEERVSRTRRHLNAQGYF